MDIQAPAQRAEGAAGQQILYCRASGLLAQAAKQGRKNSPLPLVVEQGRRVRDACHFALARGIANGQAVAQARRICPSLTVVPQEAVDARTLTILFLDLLADIAPAVEPDGPDGAFADVTGTPLNVSLLDHAVQALTGFTPAVGVGASKLAARACAECGLPPERLPEAAVTWLWPEDPKVTGRLKRLGLETFGAVAEIGEDALFYQFGRIGRLLYRRAQGQDLASVKALYPPPRADDGLDMSDFPLEDREMLQAALATLAHQVSDQLVALGRHGRRVVLRVQTERGEVRGEWLPPAAIQSAFEVTRAAQRLLMTLAIAAPVTGLRLLVEDLETAQSVTQNLFAGRMHRDTLALEAARRVLCSRYGPQALTRLSERPQSMRERRRSAEEEVWQ